jgi:hypothetical protein
MPPGKYTQFIHFLKHDLAISESSLSLALRQWEQSHAPMPMILWQYGLVTLEQLDRIYDWLATA